MATHQPRLQVVVAHPTTVPCPRTSNILVLRPPRDDAAPPVVHGPCCYWDHLTAQWVPLVTATRRAP